MDDIEQMLVGIRAEVDRLAAEMQDPTTTDERKTEIFSHLEMLYETLQELRDLNAEEAEE